MTASVGAPALTMMIAVRGRCSEAANSSYENAGTKPASGWVATSSSVLERERLNTATVLPSREARLRARFEPMTASPTTPMLATGSRSASGPVGVAAGRATSSALGAPSCTSAEAGPWSLSVEMSFAEPAGAFEDTPSPCYEVDVCTDRACFARCATAGGRIRA